MPSAQSKSKKKPETKSQFQIVVSELRKNGMPVIDGQPRTVRVDSVDPKELKDKKNPHNWREHSERQKNYVDALITSAGWAQTILFNATTNRLVNGHGRIELAIEKGYKSVPVDVGAWSEEQERELLIGIDATSSMASINANALSSLTQATLDSINKKGKKSKSILEKFGMFKDVASFADKVLLGEKDSTTISKVKPAKSVKELMQQFAEDEEDDIATNEAIVPILQSDVLFESSNEWGIPDLLPDLIYKNTKLLPTDTFSRELHDRKLFYCESSRDFKTDKKVERPLDVKGGHGFLGFFTEDWIINKLYDSPVDQAQRLAEEEWIAVVEPDFSVYMDHPFAERLWAVYRSRWCARYWQELGVHVIPNLRAANTERDCSYLLDTLPNKMPICMMQVRMGGEKAMDKQQQRMIKITLDYVATNMGTTDVIMYGSNSFQKYLAGAAPEGITLHWLTPYISKRGQYVRKSK